MIRSALIAIALTAVGATAFAGDHGRDWDHDRGGKHYRKHDRDGDRYERRYDYRYRDGNRYYAAPRYYPPPRVYYPPPRVYYPPPRVYYPAPRYYPAPTYGYGGQPSLGIQLYIPLK